MDYQARQHIYADLKMVIASGVIWTLPLATLERFGSALALPEARIMLGAVPHAQFSRIVDQAMAKAQLQLAPARGVLFPGGAAFDALSTITRILELGTV